MSASRIVVVGAGVFGAWTGWHLLQAGCDVMLVDAMGPGNALSSSGGESRLIRASYGKDAIYSRMARDSLPQWKWLGEWSGLPIFVPAGILFFFGPGEPYYDDIIATHADLGLPTEALSPAEMARRYPMIDFDGVAAGIFEPGFGALMARRAVLLLVDRFVRAGGEYRLGQVQPPRGGARLEEIILSTGERLAADRFVFAAGPWLPNLFPDVLGGKIVPTRQEAFFFSPPSGDPRFLPGLMPGWAELNGGDMFYGFPDLESRGVKFAHDLHGPPIDPDTQSRLPSEAALAEVIGYRDRRFPALRDAPLAEARVCQYENSSNGDFLIDFHPGYENLLLVGAGSGHGFKHGPEVGRYAAARLFGNVGEEPRFSLESKSAAQSREVY